MHIRFTLFFCLCFLLFSSTIGASDLMLQVEVLPGFSLQLPDTVSLTPAAPGQMVQGDVEVQVRSNTPWYLQVSGASWEVSGSGAGTDLESLLHVKANGNEWSSVSSITPRTVATGDPTGDQWQAAPVEFRFSTSYADAPGAYEIQLTFTIVPEL